MRWLHVCLLSTSNLAFRKLTCLDNSITHTFFKLYDKKTYLHSAHNNLIIIKYNIHKMV